MGFVSLRHSFSASGFAAVLSSPWLDRFVALVACIPFAYSLRHQLRNFGFEPSWIIANANFILLIGAMLVRRTATRVTPQPLFWVLAFAATYWLFIFGRYMTGGPQLAPSWLIFALSTASFAISVWARVSLGRSIGLVPAQRGLVTSGAYRFMRHPIYTGIYLAYLALALQHFSTINSCIFASGAALFVIKSFVEERFLREDAEYALYMRRVRWRWLPYLA